MTSTRFITAPLECRESQDEKLGNLVNQLVESASLQISDLDSNSEDRIHGLQSSKNAIPPDLVLRNRIAGDQESPIQPMSCSEDKPTDPRAWMQICAQQRRAFLCLSSADDQLIAFLLLRAKAPARRSRLKQVPMIPIALRGEQIPPHFEGELEMKSTAKVQLQ